VTEHPKTQATTPSDTMDTAVAMAFLWAIPVLAFLLMLTRL
jgi:hypothetical protein